LIPHLTSPPFLSPVIIRNMSTFRQLIHHNGPNLPCQRRRPRPEPKVRGQQLSGNISRDLYKTSSDFPKKAPNKSGDIFRRSVSGQLGIHASCSSQSFYASVRTRHCGSTAVAVDHEPSV
jgi:hypothetical protein